MLRLMAEDEFSSSSLQQTLSFSIANAEVAVSDEHHTDFVQTDVIKWRLYHPLETCSNKASLTLHRLTASTPGYNIDRGPLSGGDFFELPEQSMSIQVEFLHQKVVVVLEAFPGSHFAVHRPRFFLPANAL